MTAPAELAAQRPSLAPHFGIYNHVLFVLVIAATLAGLGFGFVGVAPNRLISGRPVALWTAAGPVFTAGITVIGGGLLTISLTGIRRAGQVVAALLAAAWLLLTLIAVGDAARNLIAGGGPGVRVSAGAAFWVIAGCAALAEADALQRLRTGTLLTAAAVTVLCAAIAGLAFTGYFDALSIAREYATRHALFAAAFTRHIALVAGSIGPALAIGFPLGIAAARKPNLQGPLFAGPQPAPDHSVDRAVWRFDRSAFGAGDCGPAIGGLRRRRDRACSGDYRARPLCAAAQSCAIRMPGISDVDPAVIDAARGMGLTRRQIFWRVEFPLSLPVLIAGLRVVTVQTIGLAVVAALIGAGGLGTFVFEGLGQYALDLVLLGALPAIGLALAVDFLLRLVSGLLLRAEPA